MQDNKQLEYIRAIEDDPSLLQATRFDGSTIFHVAAIYVRLQVMEAINKIDPHMKDRGNDYNETPLIYASMNDRVASVKWLLDHDAVINIKNVSGNTALFYACNQEIKDLIKEKYVEYFYFI